MSDSLLTFGEAQRQNIQLRKQLRALQTKHTGDQRRIEALIRQNNFLKKQLKKLGGGKQLE
jgi:ABC-type iron transport system FetAB ATPase subunit